MATASICEKRCKEGADGLAAITFASPIPQQHVKFGESGGEIGQTLIVFGLIELATKN